MSTLPGLESIELATTIAIGTLALLALVVPLAWYAIGAPAGGAVNRRGRGAQNGLMLVLAIAPLILVALEGVVFWIASKRLPSAGILAVYGKSVLRTLPFLGWTVGPFAVALRVAGDVLFYVQPNEAHPAAIGEECRRRLRAALAYATRNPADRVVVVAHSQGSAIAADLRQRGELQCPLLTLGSPVLFTLCALPGDRPSQRRCGNGALDQRVSRRRLHRGPGGELRRQSSDGGRRPHTVLERSANPRLDCRVEIGSGAGGLD